VCAYQSGRWLGWHEPEPKVELAADPVSRATTARC